MEKVIEFSRGRIALTVSNILGQWELGDLVDYAERVNPKRAFLFVSKVLGKHIPVKPEVMNAVYTTLASNLPEIDSSHKVTVVAMAETAVGLGAGVYRALAEKQLNLNSVFLTSTRHHVDGLPLLGEFKEEHSHAADHLIFGSKDESVNQHILDTETLILIDDEASTGKTFANLLTSLQGMGLTKVKKLITVTLTDWSNGREHPVLSQYDWDNVCLVSGSWTWHPIEAPTTKTIPVIQNFQKLQSSITAPVNWGREPVRVLPNAWANIKPKRKGEKIHVLGSGEYLWVPFLIAEQLERSGADVTFSSTTRSPVAVGGAVQEIMWFQDNYGEGVTNYFYNVNPDNYDRVILVVETPITSIDERLLLPNVEVMTYPSYKPIVLTDIDDTLLQTMRRRTPEPSDAVGTVDRENNPLGFMTVKQQMLTKWLKETSVFIPVTARSPEALNRVKIDFEYGAICSHGGVILHPNGKRDEEWHQIQKAQINALGSDLHDVMELIKKVGDAFGGVRTWIVYEDDLPLYVCAKHAEADVSVLEKALEAAKEFYDCKFYFHMNGNNLAVIPLSVSKQKAAQYLLSKMNPTGAQAVLGFGDSLSDQPFLNTCDWIGIPNNSQLNRTLKTSVDASYKEKGFYG